MLSKPIPFNDFYFRLIGIPLVALLIPPVFFQVTFNMPDYWHNALFSLFYTALYWHISRFIINQVNYKFPALKDNRKRLMWIFIPSPLIILFIDSFCHYFIDKSNLYSDKNIPPEFQIHAACLVTFVAISSMYEAMRYSQLLQQTLLEKEELSRANLQSQLEGLKNQVNPHFLFNSLNTLIQIIPEEPQTAVRFVQKMSKVYRYILEIKESDTTCLKNELTFLIAYAFLLKERFGKNLKVHLADMKAYHEYKIVPLALQIVLENAIKHNIISTQKPLTIDIFVENGDKLIVRNNLQRKNQVPIGTGTGLKNIENRYELVSDKKMEVIVTAQTFTVVLPLLV